MRWLRSRTAVVAVVGLVAVLTIALGTWQSWLAEAQTVRWVNDADDAGEPTECSTATAYADITSAVAASSADDIVRVCEGTYDETVNVGISLTIEGREGADVGDIVLERLGDGFIVTANDVTIQHITLDGPGGDTGIYVSGDDAIIEDVWALEWDEGIVLDGSSGSLVYGSTLLQNQVGILAVGGDHNEIRENTTAANNDFGVFVDGEDEALVADNDLSGTVAALNLDDDAGRLNVQVIRNTINAGSDGIHIDEIASADSLIVIGGHPDYANSFAGSPSAPDYFVDLACGADTEVTVNATYNYWGGTNIRSAIAALIYDDEDDDECGTVHGAVVFHPWTTSPAPSPSPSPTPTPTPSPTPSPTPATSI